MPSTDPLDLENRFDELTSSATDHVSAAVLDTVFERLETWVNGLLSDIAAVIRDDDTLVDQVVRARNLHSELQTATFYDAGFDQFDAKTTTPAAADTFLLQDSEDEDAIKTTTRALLAAAIDEALAGMTTSHSHDTESLPEIAAIASAPDIKTMRGSTGLIIPFYVYPSNVYTNSAYNDLIDLIKTYQTVPTIVALNPSSGPGATTDGNYTAAIQRLRGAGAMVIGYVSTDYTNHALATVKAEVDAWMSLYPDIQGIFFDEFANTDDAATTSYYEELTTYCHQRGLFSVGNAGAGVPARFFESITADVIVIWESSSMPSEATLKGDFDGGYADFDTRRRAAIVYDQSSFSTGDTDLIAKYCGYLYLTDDTAPNPWDSASSYIEYLFQQLNLASGGSGALDVNVLDSGDTISPSTHANSLILLGTLGAPSELTFDILGAGDNGKFFYINNKARGTADHRLHLHPPSGVSIWKMSDGITLWENASVLLIYDHTNTTLRLVAATGGIVTKLGVVTYFEGQWEASQNDGGMVYRSDDLGVNTYLSQYINDTSEHVRMRRAASFTSGGAVPPKMYFKSNNGNRLYVTNSSWWDVLNQDVIDGSQDMCIHVWFNAENTTSRRVFACHYEDSDNYWEFAMNNGDLYFRRKYSGSFDIELTWTTTISQDVNHHAIVAVVGGKLALYLDGTQRAYLDLSGETAHNFSGHLTWGALGNSTTGTYAGELWDFGIAYGNPFGLDPQSDNSDSYTTNERKIGVLNGYR